MFEFPLIGARRALATLSLPDSLRILDLDDPHQLVRLGLRPTDVVRRNLAVTQTWGHRIWAERATCHTRSPGRRGVCRVTLRARSAS